MILIMQSIGQSALNPFQGILFTESRAFGCLAKFLGFHLGHI